MTTPELPPPDLLPCPFCGKTHALTVDNLAGDDWYVECEACKVQQHAIYQTCSDAIDAWNARAALAAREPLTLEQIITATDEITMEDGVFIRVARAIEAAHGITPKEA